MASTSSNEAIPKNEVDTAGTLEERLKAWKHVVGNLQEYVEQHETLHKSMAKEFEKVGKVKYILFQLPTNQFGGLIEEEYRQCQSP